MKHDYRRLVSILGYQFSDYSLLALALTHRSCGSQNNERLEFLGDSILGMLVSEALFQQCSAANEGELTRLRASLVKGETLADVAAQLGLGEFLRLGVGERKSGGHRRQSILADALEALIGAIYLDGGLSACRDCITRWYGPRFDVAANDPLHKDPKTRLQELLQARGERLPVYDVIRTSGEQHAKQFTVSCKVDLLAHEVCAEAPSRRAAEKRAAQLVLDELELIHGERG